MQLKPEQLDRHLQKQLAPVYFISGDDPLRVMEAADAVRAAARGQGYDEREVLTVPEALEVFADQPFKAEIIQEAIRRYFGEPVYVPTAEERIMLADAMNELEGDPDGGRSWTEVRGELWPE